jgi:hypothetical protein
MTVRRLLITTAAMAAIGALLRELAPTPAATLSALAAAQRLVDTAGPGTLLVAAVGGLAWLAWAWGVLGLLLTVAGALPGAAGWTARSVLGVVLPAGARRAVALTLGASVALNGPLLVSTALASPTAVATTSPGTSGTQLPVPDWPAARGGTSPTPAADATAPSVPDWPASAAPTAGHVVLRDECLWDIAADHLLSTTGRTPADAEVADAVGAWWSLNAAVIGSDPDLLLPGQVLLPPGLE